MIIGVDYSSIPMKAINNSQNHIFELIWATKWCCDPSYRTLFTTNMWWIKTNDMNQASDSWDSVTFLTHRGCYCSSLPGCYHWVACILKNCKNDQYIYKYRIWTNLLLFMLVQHFDVTTHLVGWQQWIRL